MSDVQQVVGSRLPIVQTPVPIRTVLRVNAVVSGVSGLVATVAAGPLARLLGVPTAATAIVGVGLMLFAIDLVLVSRASDDRVRRFTPLAGFADAAWVAGTAVLVALGVFDPAGIAVMTAVAIVVGTFAVLELRGT